MLLPVRCRKDQRAPASRSAPRSGGKAQQARGRTSLAQENGASCSKEMLSPNVVIKPLHLVKSEKLPIPHGRPKQPYEGPRTGRQRMGRSGPHTGRPHGPPKITEMWLLGFFPRSVQLPQPIGDPSRPTPARLSVLAAGRISLGISVPEAPGNRYPVKEQRQADPPSCGTWPLVWSFEYYL